jgi:cytochrome c-type biogenesis protein CcsB
MNSSLLLSLTTFIYGFAAFGYLVAFIFRKEFIGRLASWAAIVGGVGNLAGIVLRWGESYRLGMGHAPLSNLYESLVFFAFTLIVLHLFLERRYQNRTLGVFAASIAFLAMAYASLSPSINDQIQPLIPALKSNWLIAHVISCFIGYAGFAIASGMGLMFLVKQRDPDNAGSFLSLFPTLDALDELILQLVKFGFLFLTVGIITGAVWANSAWGRYWGWDPKETWSLITWLVYATMLHFRVFLSWRGRVFAIFSIIGFLAVLFTYFGVNYLPGLHSYGVAG